MSPERNFSHKLDEALAQQRTGRGTTDILAQFPAESERLSPLMQEAQRISNTPMPEPPAGAQAASKARMMAALGKIKANNAQLKEEVVDDLGAGLHKKPGRGLVVIILALVILFIFLSTLNVAAFYALPGSWL